MPSSAGGVAPQTAANFSSTVWYYHGVTRVSRMQEGGCV